MNKTKVIATVGPVTSNKEMLKELITNGTDVIRINMSHADMAFCREIVEKINEINMELNTYTAIMIDLKGPIVQVGKVLNKSAFLKQNDKIRIFKEDVLGDNTKFSVDYKEFIKEANVGMILTLSDGDVVLKVIQKENDYLICEVLKGGYIHEHKTLTTPNFKIKRPFIDSFDLQTIKLASMLNVDYLALSYVRSSEDVLKVNDLLINLGNDHLSIIAKIENEQAVLDIDNIIKVSDGIMVARGDLGCELPVEKMPGIQKKLIDKCHKAGIISIVATEMLSTMEKSSHPTKAEVSDIANAVLDGCDAVMLSGETTIGRYPIETLKMMERVIKAAEMDANYTSLMESAIKTEKKDITGVLAYNVSGCANLLKCKAIIAPTITGHTAKKISRFRPYCPIVAISPNVDTIKSLALNFGVYSCLSDELESIDMVIEKSKIIAKEKLNLQKGDMVIVTGGYPFKEVKHTNFMKIEEI